MRILVAVDGSDPSRRAATRAADLARRLGESLTVVHVLPPPPIFSEPAVLPDVAELERRVYERGKAVLDEIADSLRHDGLEVQAQLSSPPSPHARKAVAPSSSRARSKIPTTPLPSRSIAERATDRRSGT